LETGILLGKLNGNVIISKSGFLDFIQVVILAHIVEIACKYRILRMADKDIVLCFSKLHHALWHTADHKILTVKLHCGIVQSRRQRCIGIKALFNLLYQIVLTESQHKFLHIHRIKRFHIDLSYGKREFRPIDRNAEQAACDDDVIIWSVLAEVFKRSQSPFAELHLIEYNQRFFLYDSLTCDMGQNRYQIIGADVFLKGFVQLWIGFKVEVCHIFVMGAPKLQNGIGLSDLSCAL